MTDPTYDWRQAVPCKRRWVELIIDPNSGQLSGARLALIFMNFIGAVCAIMLVWQGHGVPAAGILTGIAASDAGVYWASTRKHFAKPEDCE
jgi:hypothetical protein